MNTTATKQLIAFVLPTHLPGSGGWGNGYVAVPEGHPCYGMDYDAIHDRYEIEVNGGLTYAEKANKHHPAEVKGMWVVGFDTLHAGDNMIIWPNEESVMREAENLKRQLTELKLSENGKRLKLGEAAPDLLQALKLARMTIKELAGKEVYEQTSVATTIDAAIKKATE